MYLVHCRHSSFVQEQRKQKKKQLLLLFISSACVVVESKPLLADGGRLPPQHAPSSRSNSQLNCDCRCRAKRRGKRGSQVVESTRRLRLILLNWILPCDQQPSSSPQFTSHRCDTMDNQTFCPGEALEIWCCPLLLLCLHCFGSDLSGAFLVLRQFCNTSSSLQSCPSPAWCSRCCGWCILEGKTHRGGK